MEPAEPDVYDIEAQLAHRRFLRAASLMTRAWTRLCQKLLAETVIFRKLHDLDAVEWAVVRGYLDVAGVRAVYVDPAASGLDGPERHDEEEAWALVEERYRAEGLGAAVDRSDRNARKAMRRAHWDDADARVLLVQGAERFAADLPALEIAAFATAGSLLEIQGPWSAASILVGSLSPEEEYDSCHEGDYYERLAGAFEAWLGLRSFAVTHIDERDDLGFPDDDCLATALPIGRLHRLRIGSFAAPGSSAPALHSGALFLQEASELRDLAIYIERDRARVNRDGKESQADPASANWMFGWRGEQHLWRPEFRLPALETLILGRPADQIVAAEILDVVRALPRSCWSFTLAVGPCHKSHSAERVDRKIMSVLDTLHDAVIAERSAFEPLRFKVDLRSAGGERSRRRWLKKDSWRALATAAERVGIEATMVR